MTPVTQQVIYIHKGLESLYRRKFRKSAVQEEEIATFKVFKAAIGSSPERKCAMLEMLSSFIPDFVI